ncbi:uncharacterized protein ARMOST_02158 [Armillaria ostoyae]|uniref:Uncharacterized protein n=1 Tax=Armillaria ostoyae TaxID=47428 RepID=A0A284QQX8_ARMOS|nr:uncharacterized protein ARMOST_02158 [Armillaria ostoyae]
METLSIAAAFAELPLSLPPPSRYSSKPYSAHAHCRVRILFWPNAVNPISEAHTVLQSLRIYQVGAFGAAEKQRKRMNEYLIARYVSQRKKGTIVESSLRWDLYYGSALLDTSPPGSPPRSGRSYGESSLRYTYLEAIDPFNLIVVNPRKGLWYRPHNGSISFVYRGQYQILYKSIPMSDKD